MSAAACPWRSHLGIKLGLLRSYDGVPPRLAMNTEQPLRKMDSNYGQTEMGRLLGTAGCKIRLVLPSWGLSSMLNSSDGTRKPRTVDDITGNKTLVSSSNAQTPAILEPIQPCCSHSSWAKTSTTNPNLLEGSLILTPSHKTAHPDMHARSERPLLGTSLSRLAMHLS